MCSLVSADPSARGCGVCAICPSGVTRSDSFSTPLRPPWMISGSPLLISAARVCSNLRSMAAFMRGGHLAVWPLNCAMTQWGESGCSGFRRGAQGLFGLTTFPQLGQHLRQVTPETGARQPGRYKTRWIDIGVVQQQSGGAIGGGLEFPGALVRLEVTAHLAEGDAVVGGQIGAEHPVDLRRIPAEIDLVFDQQPALVGRML